MKGRETAFGQFGQRSVSGGQRETGKRIHTTHIKEQLTERNTGLRNEAHAGGEPRNDTHTCERVGSRSVRFTLMKSAPYNPGMMFANDLIHAPHGPT